MNGVGTRSQAFTFRLHLDITTCLFDDTNSTAIIDFESHLVSFRLPEVDAVTANCELQIWRQKLKRLVTSNDELLPYHIPNIFMLLKIVYSLPASTPTPEKSFSGLNLPRKQYERGSSPWIGTIKLLPKNRHHAR
ncbi:Hypothetical protein CINCED_3A012784 [Cinara cedri]|uniref:HAT C-terminal dimerisation domain-containing protein n=1 Tax=Cinara cedri TaxID=506608 RepID=A0A5E4MYZ0_9HEMI|nr:Hypothetical protein CINCED_3A012784 [Cinara cedri]